MRYSNSYIGQVSCPKYLNLLYFKKHYFALWRQLKQGSVYEEFLVFSTKKWSFGSFYAFSWKFKLKMKFSDNYEKNICRILHILAQYLFTTSERRLNCYYIRWMHMLCQDLPNDLNLRSCEIKKFQGNPWNAWNWWESTHPTTHTSSFGSCSTKFQKATVKHSIEKPMLLNFVDLSTIYCPRLHFSHQK